MTTMQFDCDAFAGHLAAHLEGEAPTAVSAAMTAHASACADCATLLADIVAIGKAAVELPALEPPRDLWNGVASRIETRVVAIGDAAGRPAGRPARSFARPAGRRWFAHPAVAAAALVVVTAGVTHYATLRGESGKSAVAVAPGLTGIAADSGAAVGSEASASMAAGGTTTGTFAVGPSVVEGTPAGTGIPTASARPAAPSPRLATGDAGQPAPFRQASYREGATAALDSLYYSEITRLRQLLRARRAQLAPATVQVIDRNMLVIDRAIRECREALAKDPASTFLNEQLNEALESKIELLRTAATMPIGA